MEMGSSSLGFNGASSGSNDSSLNGLKFGKKIYFEDLGGGGITSSTKPPASSSSSTSSSSPSSSKKGRGMVQGGGGQAAPPPPPRCQVEGCGEDLTGAKSYYCRHKVCAAHSKSPKVIVAGIEQRFCQQCSRFHQLREFDQGKRSCRRRLAGHNERRRKPPPGSISSRYGQLSSSFHEDGGRFESFLMDFTSPRLPATTRDVWPTVRASDRVVAGNQWTAGLDVPPSNRAMAQVVHPYCQGLASRTLYSDHEIPPGECRGVSVSDSSCALSLLSTQPWGTTTISSQAPAMPASNFGVAPVTESSIATSYLSNSWGFNRHESSGGHTHGIPREMCLGQAPELGDGQFSVEPELGLPGNQQCVEEHGHTSGNLMNWPL